MDDAPRYRAIGKRIGKACSHESGGKRLAFAYALGRLETHSWIWPAHGQRLRRRKVMAPAEAPARLVVETAVENRPLK